ncbi:hypothetical protein ACFQY4_39615 [Catellatospora bangladeshensis]|uniref:hypothetical protein n=1 Tax=Catellatospora bangladeshensis TaxID=310355 RepID=UPI003605F816
MSRRVARPTPSTSTPVAIGSSVPPWPTLRVPAMRRTRATTSCEVMPPALSTTISPSVTGRSFFLLLTLLLAPLRRGSGARRRPA